MPPMKAARNINTPATNRLGNTEQLSRLHISADYIPDGRLGKG